MLGLDPVYQFYANNGYVAARRFTQWPPSPSFPQTNSIASSLNWSRIMVIVMAGLVVLLIMLLLASSLLLGKSILMFSILDEIFAGNI